MARRTDGDIPIGWPQLRPDVDDIGDLSRMNVDGPRFLSQYTTTDIRRCTPLFRTLPLNGLYDSEMILGNLLAFNPHDPNSTRRAPLENIVDVEIICCLLG